MGNVVRVLLISDLHAFMGDLVDSSPSLIALGTPSSPGVKLIDRCAAVVGEKFDRIDALLVAGDLTHQASGAALRTLWPLLVQLAERFGASLFATAGNHDYDSRDSKRGNPKGDLLDLEPPFPFLDEVTRQHYFAYDFALRAETHFAVLALNSAAQHGYRKGAVPEYTHGSITSSTTKRLASVLNNEVLPPIKILLIHHHVSQLPGLDHAETSMVQDAQELHHVLEETGQWLIVHGHKHRPYIQTVSGGGDAPIAFSSASFGANLGGTDFAGQVQNQFHVLELESAPADAPALALAGTAHSWSYSGTQSTGWHAAGPSDALPAETGFGWKGSVQSVAAALAASLTAEAPILQREHILEVDRSIRYMTSRDLSTLGVHLKKTHGVELVLHKNGTIQSIQALGSF